MDGTNTRIVLIVTKTSDLDHRTETLGVFLDDRVAKQFCQSQPNEDLPLNWTEASYKDHFLYTARGYWCRYYIEVWAIVE